MTAQDYVDQAERYLGGGSIKGAMVWVFYE